MNLEVSEKILFDYLNSRIKKDKKQALLDAIVASGYPADDPIRLIAKNLRRCGKHITTRRGRTIARRSRCQLPFCPFCSRWIDKKETRRFLQKLEAVSDGNADSDDMSVVLINMCSKKRGDSFEYEAKKLKTRLDYRIRVDLPDVKYFGHRELAEEEDGSLRLHAHLIFYHPGISKNNLVESLNKTFKPTGRLRVSVSAQSLHKDKDMKKNVARIINYQVKGRKRVTHKEYKRLGDLGWSFMEELVKFIRSWATMWSGGLRGIRMQRGFDKRGNPELKSVNIITDSNSISTNTVE
ncbi:hypothetical protein [Thalassobaculum salexigens]|uniref:hypothetical protein n=1 Tax=Thalassobaculum salexigens TaxID=455360 RepID=UPI0012EB5278|nr:hypothetical protein [Thalassobaculum salexigens]